MQFKSHQSALDFLPSVRQKGLSQFTKLSFPFILNLATTGISGNQNCRNFILK